MATKALGAISDSPYVNENHELFQDTRNMAQKNCDLIISLGRELLYYADIANALWHDSQLTTYDHCDKKKEWNKESRGCVVFLTGLNGHPGIWKGQLAKLKDTPAIDRFIPYIPESGDCVLETAAVPILKVVEDYTKTHPGKRICLIGVSNGARIATYIETKLRTIAPNTPVKISTIAGAHFGSRWADFFKNLGMPAIPKHSGPLMAELLFGGKKAKELLDEVQKPLPANVIRSYQFFATTEDTTIIDLCSAIPKTAAIERSYRVLNGHGHNSIVNAVAEEQMRDCLNWLRA